MGLHCGKRLFAPPPIASRGSLPSGATSRIDQPPPSLCSKASSDPSCDQLGLTFSPAPSKATSVAEPSTGTTTSAEPAGLAVAIAIAAPSGDQTGPVRSDG